MFWVILDHLCQRGRRAAEHRGPGRMSGQDEVTGLNVRKKIIIAFQSVVSLFTTEKVNILTARLACEILLVSPGSLSLLHLFAAS